MTVDLHKFIRQSFDELCQDRQISIYADSTPVTHRELGLVIQALIEAVSHEVNVAIASEATIAIDKIRSQISGH